MHLWRQIFLYSVIALTLVAMQWIVYYFAISTTEKILLIIFIPLALIMDAMMYFLIQTLRNNKLVLTDAGIEYTEGVTTYIPYASIAHIKPGQSRRYMFYSGYTVPTVIVVGEGHSLGLPHWMDREKILKTILPHINQEIISKEVKAKYLH